MIERKALIHLETRLDIVEPSTPITSDSPPCLGCGVPLEFAEDALEDIAFSRMCTVTQTVFSCPACYLRMVIFPKGEVPIDSSTTEVVVGPPAEGFHIAKV